jgi:hypothetical protein
LELLEEVANACGVAPKVVRAITGRRAHIDAGFAIVTRDADADIIVEADKKRALNSFDVAGLSRTARQFLGDNFPAQPP